MGSQPDQRSHGKLAEFFRQLGEGFEAFAKHHFELMTLQEDGKTLREHLESYERQSGRRHPILAEAPELPPGCGSLWGDFMSLHTTRGSNGFGPARISFSDIDAYQRIRRVTLEPWEIDAIRRADAAYIAHHAETHRPKGGKS